MYITILAITFNLSGIILYASVQTPVAPIINK